MDQAAQIHAIDRLRDLRDALAKFKMQAQGSLGSADMEIQRAVQNLDNLETHWQAQIHHWHEEVNRARSALGFHRSLYKGEHVGETELQVRLKKAQERLHGAEERLQKTRRWQRLLPQAVNEYLGPARQLGAFLDTELRRALALLEKQSATLEAYVELLPADASPLASGGSEPPDSSSAPAAPA